MRYLPIGNELFIKNRERLVQKLKQNSVVIIHSNDILPTNADGIIPLKQNANLFYLTGIEQEETILLLAPNFPDPECREIVFILESDEEKERWEGHKYTQEEITIISGIRNVKFVKEFDSTLLKILAETENIYLESNEHIRSINKTETRNDRFIKSCKEQYPLYEYERLFPLMRDLRMIKQPREIELIQEACNITELGYRNILKTIKKGVKEYEIEADFISTFIRNRSRGFAYIPIIAGGKNSCILHYTQNNNSIQDGEVLLIDVAAEYAGYNSDITRTIPVSGKFTKRQKDVYNAVLRVKNEATKILSPGITIIEYQKEVARIMEKELLDLKLISKTDIQKQDPYNPAYKKYYMHNPSHHLGIDIHDVSTFYKKTEDNMVFTVEPGIYISEENLGIRLEDNILITKKENKNLSKNIPIEIEEIEYLMNTK